MFVFGASAGLEALRMVSDMLDMVTLVARGGLAGQCQCAPALFRLGAGKPVGPLKAHANGHFKPLAMPHAKVPVAAVVARVHPKIRFASGILG